MLLPAACGPPQERDYSALLVELEEQLTPMPAGTPHSEEGAWLERRAALLTELRQREPGLGRALLGTLGARADLPPPVRLDYLDLAAHCAPEEAVPRLVETFDTYGLPIGERNQACRLLAQVAPQRTIELLEPILTQSRPGRTLPPSDRLLEYYVQACGASDLNPNELLAEIAVDWLREDPVRRVAIQELAHFPGPLTEQALKQVLIESTGNGNLRRKAAQSLLAIQPGEELCTYLQGVLEREADPSFQSFLGDLLVENCQ